MQNGITSSDLGRNYATIFYNPRNDGTNLPKFLVCDASHTTTSCREWTARWSSHFWCTFLYWKYKLHHLLHTHCHAIFLWDTNLGFLWVDCRYLHIYIYMKYVCLGCVPSFKCMLFTLPRVHCSLVVNLQWYWTNKWTQVLFIYVWNCFVRRELLPFLR